MKKRELTMKLSGQRSFEEEGRATAKATGTIKTEESNQRKEKWETVREIRGDKKVKEEL